MEFKAWPKIPRLSNEKYWVTEKLDGTNACIIIQGTEIACQSRNRLITPEDDNYGFARWVYDNREELLSLGDGYHYGEWWGLGIQRGYDQDRKRFSLFNTARWNDKNPNRPACCDVVPLLGSYAPHLLEVVLKDLQVNGSKAAPGFMRVEGVVVYSELTRSYYKVILDK